MPRFLFLFLFLSCRNTKSIEETGVPIDSDGDGYIDLEDCDDTNPSIYPDADEICDGTDNNCNGEIDEGLGVFYFVDADGDGFGNDEEQIEAFNREIRKILENEDIKGLDNEPFKKWSGTVDENTATLQ